MLRGAVRGSGVGHRRGSAAAARCGGGAAGVARPGGESGGDDSGDFAGCAGTVGGDERVGGGAEFGSGGVRVEQLGADELAQGVGGAAEHGVVLPWRCCAYPLALAPHRGSGVAAGVGGGGYRGRREGRRWLGVRAWCNQLGSSAVSRSSTGVYRPVDSSEPGATTYPVRCQTSISGVTRWFAGWVRRLVDTR